MNVTRGDSSFGNSQPTHPSNLSFLYNVSWTEPQLHTLYSTTESCRLWSANSPNLWQCSRWWPSQRTHFEVFLSLIPCCRSSPRVAKVTPLPSSITWWENVGFCRNYSRNLNALKIFTHKLYFYPFYNQKEQGETKRSKAKQSEAKSSGTEKQQLNKYKVK